MVLKSLVGGMLAVLLTVFVVFNVVMPAMTIVAVFLASLAAAVTSNPVMLMSALLPVLGIVYLFFRKK